LEVETKIKIKQENRNPTKPQQQAKKNNNPSISSKEVSNPLYAKNNNQNTI